MKFIIIYLIVALISIGCNDGKKMKILEGYIVYILPDNVRFVETKRMADTDYAKHFVSENFNVGISFKPNCVVEEMINKIIPDTLRDENPALADFTTFMKEPLIFPAEIIILDTSEVKTNQQYKFKIFYQGKNREFHYVPFNGVIIELKRLKK